MQNRQAWKARFEQEIRLAEAARSQGNEGRSRVCARRAAGIAAGEFFQRKKLASTPESAYERLRMLTTWPEVPPAARSAAQLLAIRVTTSHMLPVEADLIAEARLLAQALLEND